MIGAFILLVPWSSGSLVPWSLQQEDVCSLHRRSDVATITHFLTAALTEAVTL